MKTQKTKTRTLLYHVHIQQKYLHTHIYCSAVHIVNHMELA
jgi:hypothetical protein